MSVRSLTIGIFAPIAGFSLHAAAQSADTSGQHSYDRIVSQIVSAGLGSGRAFPILQELTARIGPRLSGSPAAGRAVTWAEQTMEKLGFEDVHTEPVMVPHWVRGSVEEASILTTADKSVPLTICALGGSVATPEEGITAEVVEVKSFDELRSLGGRAAGKIVFFNRPFDRTKFNTFEAYGGAVNQRGQGASEAARAGGVAALVRSMTSRIDDVPHTGAMNYNDSLPKVPTAAVSTAGANLLDSLLAANHDLRVRLRLSCRMLPDTESANVVGELKGSEHPEEVVLVGGHLDSWDKGRGAHDDGAGCSHSIEALRLLKELGLTPKRTIRAVLFMNEENGLRGGRAYAAKERPGEKHIAAIETDAGGFTPRGFGVTADSLTVEKVARWASLFKPIDADRIQKGGGGADISELGRKGVPTIGLRVDGQRYFDYHHSDSDTIDKVNERELELGAISLAILCYVLAQEGL
jgi:carboxypeptidase Q